MSRYKYYEEDSWESPSSVDNSTDDPTYEVAPARRRAPPGRPRVRKQSQKNKRTVVSNDEESGVDDSAPGTPTASALPASNDGSTSSNESGSDSLFQRTQELRGKSTRRPRQQKVIEEEPYSFGIADLPPDFGWTDKEPEVKSDFFQPLKQPGHVFQGDELPVELFLAMHRPALEMLIISINETGRELVDRRILKRFREVDWDELMRFHAILIICQAVQISRWEFYWKRSCPFYQPFVAEQMSFKRFK